MPKLTAEQIAQQTEMIEDELTQWGDFRPDYSGRGMYGKTCPGIDTDTPTRVIEEAGALGLRGAVTDSMGKGTIVYWPHLAR